MNNKELIEFAIDGGSIVFEGINDKEQQQTQYYRGSRGDEQQIIPAKKTLHQAINTAKSAAELVLNSFKEMNAPDEIELQFGITMAAKAGVIVASASSEANFQINLKWTKKDGA